MGEICDEIVYNILEYMEADEIIRIKRVSKQLNNIANDKYLWKGIYKKFIMKKAHKYELSGECYKQDTELGHQERYKKICNNIKVRKFLMYF
jgi:hypothetical protein